MYQELEYTLIGQFWQILSTLSIADIDEICDMAAVRDLSTSDMVFKSVINNKLKEGKCLHEEQKDCVKTWSKLTLQSFPPVVERD